MARTLASRLSAVAPSVTLAMNTRALDLKSRGVDVFAFGVGEPDFEPPQSVLDAAKAAIDKGCSKYTAVSGIPALRGAVCEATERMRGWRPKPENVCVSVGAKHALFNLAIALYEPGDEVVIPKPYWVSYPEQVRMMGATPVLVDTEESAGWKLSPRALESAFTPRTKAIILCTPSNPSGATYAEEDLLQLLDVVRKHDCWLIVDEIYGELVYDGLRYVSVAKLAPDLADSTRRRGRCFEDVCYDGMAHRVGHRSHTSHQGARRRPRPEHDEPDRGRAARRARRVAVPSGRLREDARFVRAATERHGRGAFLDSRHPLSHASRRLLCVRRLPRPHRAKLEWQGPGLGRRHRVLDARQGSRRSRPGRSVRRPGLRAIQLRGQRGTNCRRYRGHPCRRRRG